MGKKLKKLTTILLATFMLLSHINVMHIRADELAENPGFGEVTEVTRNGNFNTPIIGEIDEGEEEQVNPYDAVYKDTDLVRVTIVLDGNSALDAGYAVEGIGTNRGAINYRNTLKKTQEKVAAKISSKVLKGEALDVVWNHTLIANMMSAYVPYGTIEAIKNISGVKDVFIENRYEVARTSAGDADRPNMISSRDMTRSDGENASQYSGAGSKIAIIDSGLDLDHQSFDADAFVHAAEEGGFTDKLMTEDDVNDLAASLNVPGVYLNAKLPFIYNYVDSNTDVTHLNDTGSDHGSHVAGIAAANRYLNVNGSFVEARDECFVVGQAPDAQVFVMKVFGKGGGAYDSDYFAAIEDAIVLGADAVNLSLGSSYPGFIYVDNAYQDILNGLSEKGTVVVFSAGNNSNWGYDRTLYSDDINYSAGGTPGTYTNTLSVASVDNDGYTGNLLNVGGTGIQFTESGGYGNKPIVTALNGDYEYIYLDAPGITSNPGDSYSLSLFSLIADKVKGRVAACNRGGSSFFAKANAAVESGAIATIIVNNQPGTIAMNLTGYEHTEPAVSVTQASGKYFKSAATETGSFTGIELIYDADGKIVDYDYATINYYIGTISVSDEIQHEDFNSPNYTMSEFSSWGVPGSLTLKPEITAPGGDIYSVYGYGWKDDGSAMEGGHDQYTLMSGTSMAAPQITGIIAVIGQYYRENNIEEKTGLTLRQFAQSLIMSTAEPLTDEYGDYYPVLQQGAGLVKTDNVVSSKTFIHMSEDDGNLTTMTGAAADYKVKAELGQDAARSGAYEYTFEITNFGKDNIKYQLSTDLFTQDIYDYPDVSYLTDWTIALSSDTKYVITIDVVGHDVNKDGVTNSEDAQAILDYLTGVVDGEELDLEAGKLDEDDEVTSRDAYLLLLFLEEQGIGEDWFYLRGGETATVTVKMDVSDSELAYRENGGYVEGYTYVSGDDGIEHSIPVLGYFGSWTDSSMYDAVTYVEKAMESTAKESYFGAGDTNGYQLKYQDGRTAWFSGNPYVAEPEITDEKFAINSKTVIKNVRYSLIRNSVAKLFVVKDGSDSIVKTSGFGNAKVYGAFYNSQTANPGWFETTNQNLVINSTPADLGYGEGDQFSIGIYTVPEYYGVVASEGQSSSLTESQLKGFIEGGEVGAGAAIEYKFTVDNKEPEISKFEINEDATELTVTAKDDNYIAFIGLTDINGQEIYVYEIPEQSAKGQEVTVTLDLTQIKELPNAAALIVGDYARNEMVKLARFAEGPIVSRRTVFVLTDELSPYGEYVIADSNVAGDAYALNSQGRNYYTNTRGVKIVEDADGMIYIPAEDVEDSTVWLSYPGFMFQNEADSGVLGYNGIGYPFVSWANTSYADVFVYTEDHHLILNREYYEDLYAQVAEDYGYSGDLGLSGYSQGYFWFDVPGDIYLYEKVELVEEIDPEVASSVTIEPTAVTLIIGVDETRELKATVAPVTVEDKSVTWTSSDPAVAAVDENGVVKAVSVGTVTVTAASNQTPETTAEITVNVVEAEPMNAYIYAQIADGDGIGFDIIDLNDMSTYPMAEVDENLNGGRSGSYFYGTNSGGVLRRFDLEDFSEDEEFASALQSSYVMTDGASVFGWTNGSLDYPYVAAGVTDKNILVFYTAGTNLWYLDATDLEQIVAIALIDIDTRDMTDPTFYYALLSDQGTVYIYYVYGIVLNDGSIDIDGAAIPAGTISGMTFGDDPTAYSMTCGFGHVFDENDDLDYDRYGLFVADNTSKGIYYLDLNELLNRGNTAARFVGVVEGATNISGLFNDVYDAVTAEDFLDDDSLIPGFILDKAPVSAVRGQKVELAPQQPEAVEAESVAEAVEEPVAETVEEVVETAEEPVAEVEEEVVVEETSAEVEVDAAGTLNRVIGYNGGTVKVRNAEEPETEEAEAAEEGETVAVEIKASDLSNNGLYAVTYDPDALVYDRTESDLEFTSDRDDAEGTVKFAFADLEGVEDGEVIATVYFKQPCEDTVVTVTTNEANEELGLSESTETELTGAGHEWSEPEWTWSSDHKEATAKFVCEKNEKHETEVTEKAVIETTPATEDKEGKRVYTVTVIGPDGEEYTTEYIEIIPAGVDTGDASNIVLWSSVFAGSMVVIAAILLLMKKKGYFYK